MSSCCCARLPLLHRFILCLVPLSSFRLLNPLPPSELGLPVCLGAFPASLAAPDASLVGLGGLAAAASAFCPGGWRMAGCEAEEQSGATVSVAGPLVSELMVLCQYPHSDFTFLSLGIQQ